VNQRAAQLWAAFMARAPREKVLLLGVAVALVFMLGDALLTGPAWAQRQQAHKAAQAADQALEQLRAGLSAQAQQRDATRQQQASERGQLQQQLAQLKAATPQPLDGARTLQLLETLVARQQGKVLLVALSAQPDAQAEMKNAAPAQGAASAPAAPRLYRHGLQVVVAGPYAALHDYVQWLGQEPQLQVQGWHLSVREHPQLELTLQIQTVSPEAAWLTL
jgi:MSHA biogenesis protein MshJ